jgi:hypothetical protein
MDALLDEHPDSLAVARAIEALDRLAASVIASRPRGGADR